MKSFKSNPDFSIEKIYLVSAGVEKELSVHEASESEKPNNPENNIYILTNNGAEKTFEVVESSVVGAVSKQQTDNVV